MATLRLSNPKGTFSLKGFDSETRRKIRQALRSGSSEVLGGVASLDSGESNSKWHNVRTTVDGITFASKHEAERYAELKLEQLAGEITELELQKHYRLDVNGVHICDYVADFVYKRHGVRVTEDAKGKQTELYRVKKELMRAIYGIDIVES